MKTLLRLMQTIGATARVAGDAEISHIAIDSRDVVPGTLFVARKGWYADGHRYIPDAVKAGAVAILVSREDLAVEEWGVPVYFHPAEDPTLGLLASEFYDHPTRLLHVYGVTGTNGKTSTAWMLDHILRSLGAQTSVLSTIAYRIASRWLPAPNTTPDALIVQRLARQALDAGCDSLVMEVSSHGTAHGRVAGTRFAAAGFSNFSRDHLDFHGDEASYLRAKAILFSLYLRSEGQTGSAVWVDGPARKELADLQTETPQLDEKLRHLTPLAQALGPVAHPTMISLDGNDASVHLKSSEGHGSEGTRIVFSADGHEHTLTLRAPGDFQVANALLAMTMIQRVRGNDWAELCQAMESFTAIPGRFELVTDPAVDEPAVFVDYAHTPEALNVVLNTARNLARPPLAVVVGAGGDRDRGKRPIMGRIADQNSDICVLTSDNPRTEDPQTIVEEVASGVSESSTARVEVDRRRAITAAIEGAQGGTVLIAGKGHERYEEVGRRRYFWADADEARIALAMRRYDLQAPARFSGWSAAHLAQVLQGRWAGLNERPLFRGVSTDTRTLKPGDVFFALRGEHFDAHTLLEQARSKGAACAVVESANAEVKLPQLTVASTHQALENYARTLLSEARSSRAGLATIAITGSNGKTTTRTFATAFATLLDGRAPLETYGNFNNQIGLPLSVAALSTDHRVAILEMGANRAGDIRDLVEIAPPDVAVLTSIGASHLEGFTSLDGIRRAKAEMLDAPSLRAVILPWSERAQWWGVRAQELGLPVYTFGEELGATLRAWRASVDGPVELEGSGPWAGFRAAVDVPVPGRHNAGNLAAALLAVCCEGSTLKPAPSEAELQDFAGVLKPAPGRMERYDASGRRVVFDAYNANPASTLAAIQMLDELPGSRMLVLGELFELGEEEARWHEEVLRSAAAVIDTVVAIGPRWPRVGLKNAHVFLDRDAAMEFIEGTARPSTALLWKGSRGARLEQLRDAVEARWRKDTT